MVIGVKSTKVSLEPESAVDNAQIQQAVNIQALILSELTYTAMQSFLYHFFYNS
jgi:copper chaperone CopZ